MKTEFELVSHLKKNFGFDTFKGSQEEVIQNVLNGNDSFVLMPTEEVNHYAINYQL